MNKGYRGRDRQWGAARQRPLDECEQAGGPACEVLDVICFEPPAIEAALGLDSGDTQTVSGRPCSRPGWTPAVRTDLVRPARGRRFAAGIAPLHHADMSTPTRATTRS